MVVGDSHARNIAGLTAQLLPPRIQVTGLCKPGANLQQVLTPRQKPPVRGERCDVLIAGTNDLASGKQCSLYHNLEDSIKSRPANTKLILATLPHRHDLPPAHNIHEETALVNAYIEELAARHNIAVLDINRIPRRYFTRHGMHLREQGKWQLARLLVDALYRADQTSRRTAAGLIPVLRQEQAAKTFTLPYESYADAAKIGTPSDNNILHRHRQICLNDREHFLGPPLLAPPKK